MQLWAGDLYPRWLQNLDGGLGGPTFVFYPPVPFFITSLLQPFAHGAGASWRLLGASAALALLLSGVFAYAWLADVVGRHASAAAAMLYMLMPYHYAVDLHTRGAFGEVWAFVWIPLVLLCAGRAARRSVAAAAGLAASYALLIATHLPTTLIFSVIPPAYAFARAAPRARVKATAVTVGAMLLGIGLAAVYLLPAMLDQDSVAMSIMRTGDSYYANGFFFPHPAWTHVTLARNDFERTLFWATLGTAFVGAYGWAVARRTGVETARHDATFWGIVGLVSVMMMLPVSMPVYRLVPPLQLIQFPWRFNVLLVLAATFLIALALDSMVKSTASSETRSPRSPTSATRLGSLLLALCVAFAVGPLMNTSFRVGAPLTAGSATWRSNNWNTAEYRPRWAPANIEKSVVQLRGAATTIPRARIVNGDGVSRVAQWKPRRITLATDGSTIMIVAISQYFYPGWVATLDSAAAIPVDLSPADGLLQLSVPQGRHTIEMRLRKSRAETLGGRISLSSVIGFVLLVFVSLVGNRSARDREAIAAG